MFGEFGNHHLSEPSWLRTAVDRGEVVRRTGYVCPRLGWRYDSTISGCCTVPAALRLLPPPAADSIGASPRPRSAEMSDFSRAAYRRVLTRNDPSMLQISFDQGVLDRYRGAPKITVVRTHTKRRVSQDGG